MSTSSRLRHVLWGGFLCGAAALGVLLGLSGLAKLIEQDVVTLTPLGETVVGFGLALVASSLANDHIRSGFTRGQPPGAP